MARLATGVIAAEIIAALMKSPSMTISELEEYSGAAGKGSVRRLVKQFKAAGVIAQASPARGGRYGERVALCVRPFELPKEIKTWEK